MSDFDFQFHGWNHAEEIMMDWGCICQTAFNNLSIAEAHAQTEIFSPLMYKFMRSYGAYTLMLWTGMYDRSGRKVYQGDVVDIVRPHGMTARGVCAWNHIEVGFCFLTTEEIIRPMAIQPGKWNLALSIQGNVFEDPNLFPNGQHHLYHP